MPTYGYQCPACGHEYEEFQKMNDAARVACPKCGIEGERLISGGAGVVFKGSGFYETDYKRAKPADETKPSGGDGTSDSSKKTGEKPSPTEKKKGSGSKGDG